MVKVFQEVEINLGSFSSSDLIEELESRDYIVSDTDRNDELQEDYEKLIDRLTNLRYDLIEASERNDGKRVGQILRKFFSDELPSVV